MALRDIFISSGTKRLVTAVAVLFALYVFTSAGQGRFLSSLIGFVTTPLLQVTASASDTVTEYLDLDSMTKEELKAENLRLSEENTRLRAELLDYYEVLRENEQLRSQLGVSRENPEVSYVAASVIARNPGDVFHGFSIDKGSLAGVKSGDPVVTNEGLVGITTEVYATTSHVKTLFSEDVKVGALVKSEQVQEGGVIGSGTMLAANGLLRMDYLLNDTKIQENDLVIASGAGGVYPENLTIGYVVSVDQSEYSISKYAIVQPYADIKNASEVFVITDFPGKNSDETAPPEGDVHVDPEAGE